MWAHEPGSFDISTWDFTLNFIYKLFEGVVATLWSSTITAPTHAQPDLPQNFIWYLAETH